MQNPFDPGYYKTSELREFGFKSVGENVLIARNATIIGLHNISIGHNVRIDGLVTIAAANGFCDIGSFIHIGGSVHLICGGGISLADFSGLAPGAKVFSVSDDYSGASLTNPTIPSQFQTCATAPVTIGRHVIVGSGAMVLPGVKIGEGSAVGALSLVRKSLDSWGVYSGVPVRFITKRKKDLLEAETRLWEYLKEGD